VVWVILQKRVYRCRIRDVDHLKERLIAEWRRFDQNIIDSCCQPVAGATVWVCQRERRTLSASNLNDQTNLTAVVFVNRIFDRFYSEFDF